MSQSSIPRTLKRFVRVRERSERFEQLAAVHESFTYVPALNSPLDDDAWNGFVGFVQDAANAYLNGRFSEHKAYLCGPSPMIDHHLGA